MILGIRECEISGWQFWHLFGRQNFRVFYLLHFLHLVLCPVALLLARVPSFVCSICMHYHHVQEHAAACSAGGQAPQPNTLNKTGCDGVSHHHVMFNCTIYLPGAPSPPCLGGGGWARGGGGGGYTCGGLRGSVFHFLPAGVTAPVRELAVPRCEGLRIWVGGAVQPLPAAAVRHGAQNLLYIGQLLRIGLFGHIMEIPALTPRTTNL